MFYLIDRTYIEFHVNVQDYHHVNYIFTCITLHLSANKLLYYKYLVTKRVG